MTNKTRSRAKNALQAKMVRELLRREQGLTSTLGLVEERLQVARQPGEETQLEAKADGLARDLTDIDEMLRLLEAR